MRLKNTVLGITAAAMLASGAPHDAGAQKKRAPAPQKPCSSMIVKKGNPEGCSVKKNENEIEGMECDIAIPGNRFRRVSFSGVFLAGIKDSDLPAVIATNMMRAAEGKLEREGCTTTPIPDFVPDKGEEPAKPSEPQKGKPKPAEPQKPAATPEAGKQKSAEPQKPPAPKEPTRVVPPKPAAPQKPAGQKTDDDGDVTIPPKPGTAPPPKPQAPASQSRQLNFDGVSRRTWDSIQERKAWLIIRGSGRPNPATAITDGGRPWSEGSLNRLSSKVRPLVVLAFKIVSSKSPYTPTGTLVARLEAGKDGYVKTIRLQGAVDEELAKWLVNIFSKIPFTPDWSKEPEFNFTLQR